MPFPYEFQETEPSNNLILEELAYSMVALANERKILFSNMIDEQKSVYNKIMLLSHPMKVAFFLYMVISVVRHFL